MYDGAKVPFQSYALATRVAKVAFETLKSDKHIAVLERWINDDLLFATANLEGVDFANYAKLWQQVAAMNRLGRTFTVWLQTDVNVCLDRIKARGRSEEAAITKEYLNNLVAPGGYDVIVDNTSRTPLETAKEIVRQFAIWRIQP